jgi:hypothetical protein
MRGMICSICLLTLFFAAGCTQAPKKLESAQIRVAVNPADAGSRVLTVEGIIYNESGAIAFANYSAEIAVKGKDGNLLFKVPVHADTVFPFASVKLSANYTADKASFDRIASALSIQEPSVPQEKDSMADENGVQIPVDQVSLEKVTCSSSTIEKILKEGK